MYETLEPELGYLGCVWWAGGALPFPVQKQALGLFIIPLP